MFYKLLWNNVVPLKVSAFAWNAIQNRMPTKQNLLKRGVNGITATQSQCTLCGDQTEDKNHVLSSSHRAGKVLTPSFGIKAAAISGGKDHFFTKCWSVQERI